MSHKKALKNIEEKYYRFPTFTDSGKKYITRERFCCELCRQMRTIQKENDKNNENYELKKLTLNGEPDKSGHQIFKMHSILILFFICREQWTILLLLKLKDTVISRVLEKMIFVKLCKLTKFVQNNIYQYGIMLIFNYSIEKAIPVIQEIVEESCFCS